MYRGISEVAFGWEQPVRAVLLKLPKWAFAPARARHRTRGNRIDNEHEHEHEKSWDSAGWDSEVLEKRTIKTLFRGIS